jgi:hypothetical protein
MGGRIGLRLKVGLAAIEHQHPGASVAIKRLALEQPFALGRMDSHIFMVGRRRLPRR